MDTLKEYDEQIAWIKTDGYKWGLRAVMAILLTFPLIFIVIYVGCQIMELVPAWEPYTRYNVDEIIAASLPIAYIFGFLIACLFVGKEKSIQKEIKRTEKAKQEHIEDIRQITRGE